MGFKRPRIRLTPQLSSITLDNVLSGETCEPISLADFEYYLTFKEHSVENLRFVVWYQSYRRRFFALPLSQQRLSPGPRGFEFALPTPARTAQRISRSSMTLGSMVDEPSSPTASLNTPSSPTSLSPMLSRISSSLTAYTPASISGPPEIQPFREECHLVASTFLVQSAPHEISLPSSLLSTILRDLASNTHPDVFLPAYEYAYDALLTHSLPHFLEGMQGNVNWEKKMYWWLYGLLTSCIGWAICIGCLFIKYGPNTSEGRLRAWRLLGVPFLSIGAMQMYSGYRGFCSQVWGRGGMQLRPWELASPPASSEHTPPTQKAPDKKSRRMSASSSALVARNDVARVDVFECRRPSVVPEEQPGTDDADDIKTPYATREDIPSSPSTSRKAPYSLPPIITDGYRDVWDDAPSPHHPPTPPPASPTHALHQRARAFFFRSQKSSRHDAPYTVAALSTRAKVFGPERVVLDPRIRAVHRRVMRDMLIVGFVAGCILTVVVVALPCQR